MDSYLKKCILHLTFVYFTVVEVVVLFKLKTFEIVEIVQPCELRYKIGPNIFFLCFNLCGSNKIILQFNLSF